MNRLWVRLSLAISLYTLALLMMMVGLFVMGAILTPHNFGMPPGEFGRTGRHLFFLIPAGLLRVMVPVGLFGLGAGVWVSRGLSRPITELVAGVRRVGAGELGHRVETKARSQEIMTLTEAFNQMSADLQQAEQVRNNLMADVSHELRTPLTVLEGNLRAAIDNVIELDEAELVNLYRQTRHLTRLVNDLRDVALAEARQLPLHTENFDVAELVREVAWNWEPAAQEAGVTVKAETPNEAITLSADPGRFRQMLSNLISNSLRHTPPGGLVTVAANATDSTVHLTITDTGTGIGTDMLPHIFDRFYRADKSRSRETGGSGLGLAIVKGIVESHNGRITASSLGTGKGATFSIRLPLDVLTTPQVEVIAK